MLKKSDSSLGRKCRQRIDFAKGARTCRDAHFGSQTKTISAAKMGRMVNGGGQRECCGFLWLKRQNNIPICEARGCIVKHTSRVHLKQRHHGNGLSWACVCVLVCVRVCVYVFWGEGAGSTCCRKMAAAARSSVTITSVCPLPC